MSFSAEETLEPSVEAHVAAVAAAARENLFKSWEYEGYSIHQVGADLGGEAFLLKTDDGATALFDTGFAYCAPQTLENIYAVTGNRAVDKIVLTHSHYDHMAACGYLCDRMPKCKVYASAHAAHVFTRPGAFVTMSALNASRAQSNGIMVFEDVSDNVHVDTILGDGDTFTVGSLEFTTLAAPGHTKCCIAFWCEEAGLFVSSETSGVVCATMPASVDIPDDVTYMIDLAPLVGYTISLEHIERVKQLPIRVLLATHYGCISGSDVAAVWRATDFWREYVENLVVGMHNKGCSVEEIIDEHKKVFYWGGTAPYQPEPAYDLNASYAIPSIIRDVCAE